MKKQVFLFKVLILVVAYSFSTGCTKEVNTEVQIDGIDELPIQIRSERVDFGPVDGYVILQSSSYYGSCDRAKYLVNGSFNEGMDVGGLNAEGINVQKVTDQGKIRYIHRGEGAYLNQAVAAGRISCSLSSTSSLFTSFSRNNLKFPKDICAKSSLGDGNKFPKDRDLTITWATDSNSDVVYISICAAGSPCIFKEVPDTGSYTVSKNEFAAFQPGAYVLFHVGRGYGEILTQTNGKKIGLVTAAIVAFPDIYVE